jgi:hypothetical protein
MVISDRTCGRSTGAAATGLMRVLVVELAEATLRHRLAPQGPDCRRICFTFCDHWV